MRSSSHTVKRQGGLHLLVVSALGAGLIALAIALAYGIWEVWPAVEMIDGTAEGSGPTLSFLGWSDEEITGGQVYLLLVALFGALGSLIQTATSFTTYVGGQKFRLSWTGWYLLRPIVGAIVAVLLVSAVLGGLVAVAPTTEPGDLASLNPYALVTLAGLGGWFSKAAADKLKEVFDVLLSSRIDATRADKLQAPSPTIDLVTIDRTNTDGKVSVVVAGRHFSADSVLRVGGKDIEATLHPSGADNDVAELHATIPATAIEHAELEVVTFTEFGSAPIKLRPLPG